MGESPGVLLTPSILGPNPGLSIIRIWQGVVEICLRLTIAVSLRGPETELRLVCCLGLHTVLQSVYGGSRRDGCRQRDESGREDQGRRGVCGGIFLCRRRGRGAHSGPEVSQYWGHQSPDEEILYCSKALHPVVTRALWYIMAAKINPTNVL